MIEAVAGKYESAAIKADLAIAGKAVSLLVQTILPPVDPTFDLSGLEAGLPKASTASRSPSPRRRRP